MEVTFRKVDGGRLCRWDAVRRKRTRVPGPTVARGATVRSLLVRWRSLPPDGELVVRWQVPPVRRRRRA